MATDAERNRMKQRAAAAAVAELRDGRVLGLGSGSTVDFVLTEVANRIAAGLNLVGIPSSRRTAERARALGIPLADFTAHRRIDLTIDGADQVERGTLTLVKGLGGALLREKIIAEASDRMIVVADETKLVDHLNDATPLPIEITPFGWPAIIDRLTALGVAPQLRLADDQPVVTDNGNYLADCFLAAIPEPARLDRTLTAIAGVVATGLFIGLAGVAIIGTASGVETLVRRPAL